MIPFCRDQISTHQSGEITWGKDYMGKSVLIPASRDKFPPEICLQKPINSH